MTRLQWALARIPVSMLVAGVGRLGSVLPKPLEERSRPEAKWAPAPLGLGMLDWVARTGARQFHDRNGPWRELGNKVEAFAQFRRAGVSSNAEAEGGSGEDVFGELWRREGRAYLSGLASVSRGKTDTTMLPQARFARRDLVTRHTGMGLGLAVGHLADLGPRSSAAEVQRAVGRFVDHCRRLSYPGYVEASIEALGLTVRLLHAYLLTAVEEALRHLEPAFRSLFWHGVGRGIYFDLTDMAPRRDDRWSALARAIRVADDQEARWNAFSGVAWALTLVNLRHPAIVASRVLSEAASDTGDPVANGVASATVLWRESVGDEGILRCFLSYLPRAGAADQSDRHQRLVDAVELAQRTVHPLLHEKGRLGELFRYRPVSGWIESLGGGVEP